MKFAIFGAGALGGYFGGRLLQAGHEVSFIARGAHLDALKSNGLILESQLGDAHLTQIEVTDNPQHLAPVDVVLFLVKLQDTDLAARTIDPLIGRDTIVVTFQNGIDSAQRLSAFVEPERLLAGSAYISAHVRVPGVVRHSSKFARLVFGELEGKSSERAKALAQAFSSAGVENELVDNVQERIWEKFVFLSAFSAVTAVTRLPIGKVLADPQCSMLYREALNEAMRVGLKACLGLQPDIADQQWALTQTLQPAMRASMLDDLERGKPIELEHLSGAIVRLGERHDCPTPVHRTIYQALHPYLEPS